MVRPLSYILIASLFLPGFLTSEPPQIALGGSNTLPVEILFSGVTPFDTGASVLLRMTGKSDKDVTSPCKNKTSVVNSDDISTVIQWKPTDTCTIPLISVGGKNYILPVNGYYPDDATLSDVSTDTLRNTLEAGSLLRADYRLSSFRVRSFFTSIENVLSARNTKFSLPIP